MLCAADSSALDRGKLITQYVHDVWKTNEGLPQDSVYSIVQTPDGYLWLATQEGLARFDGTRFTIFNSGNTAGIGDIVYALMVNRQGVLWIGTGGGLLSYQKGKFTRYDAKDGLPDATVTNIYEDAQNNLWLGSGSGNDITGGTGLTRFKDGRGETLTTRNGLSSDQIYKVLEDKSGNLWVATSNGLNLLKDGKFTVYTTKNGLADNFVETIYEDRTGNLWVGTLNGLNLFKDGKFTVYTAKDGLAGNRIHSIYEDTDGNLWIGTEKGLSLFKDGTFTAAKEISGLDNSRIRSFWQDKEDSLWIGTQASGLHRLRDGKFTSFGAREGLLGDNIYGIYADSTNRIWVNTVFLGLNRFEEKRFEPFKAPGNTGESTVYEDRDGVFWFGTTKGLTELRDGAFKNYSDKDGLYGNVSVICQASNGDLWLGSRERLQILREGKFIQIGTEQGFYDHDIKFIHEDQSGRIWLGTNNGLTYYKDGKFTTLTENVPRDFNPQSVSEDADGTLWFGTWSQGLQRFKDEKLTAITTQNGLYDNIAWAVLDDQLGNLWMGSNRGIFRVSKQELNDVADGKIKSVSSIIYGTTDGLRERETNSGHPGAMRAPDGKLWFGTVAGAVVIDPKNINIDKIPPPVILEKVLIDEANTLFDAPLILAANTRNVEFHYVGLSFIAPEKISYKYKLENFDESWVDAGNRREAFYTNLPPGEYEFRVMAANADGIWNEQGANIKFRVSAPFWRKWWFLLLCVALVGGAAYLLHRQRINKLEKRRLRQEEFSRRLLASQEQERQRIAAELHDSIGQSLLIIKNRAFLALNDLSDPEIIREQLEELGDSAAGVIEECREISYNLRPFQLKRFGLTKTLEAIFGRISEVTATETIINLDSIDGLFSDDAEANIYRVIQECVNNIIKHSQAKKAELIIRRSGQTVVLQIADDGRGFDDVYEVATKKSGFGLLGMKERVRLIGGEMEIESAAQKGTNIKITLSVSVL